MYSVTLQINYTGIPSVQSVPIHCCVQVHVKPSIESAQIPPLKQGKDAHSSISVEEKSC